jgi:thiol-disulfide isomerase/thioredoxin
MGKNYITPPFTGQKKIFFLFTVPAAKKFLNFAFLSTVETIRWYLCSLKSQEKDIMAEQKNQKVLWLTVAVAAVILAAVALWALMKPKPAENSQDHHQHSPLESHSNPTINDIVSAARTWGPAYTSWIGRTAPDFTLTDISGKKHKLSGYRGKDVLLVFWATWCAPCIMEIPHLIELRETTGEDKLAMLAISYTSVMPPNTIDKIKDFVKQNKEINYTVLPAEVAQMPDPYNRVNAIPCSFFIDTEGKIKLATEGLISLREVKAILQAK